jgi:hypothetical protein
MRRNIHTRFRSEILKERNHLEDIGLDARAILIWALKRWDGRA